MDYVMVPVPEELADEGPDVRELEGRPGEGGARRTEGLDAGSTPRRMAPGVRPVSTMPAAPCSPSSPTAALDAERSSAIPEAARRAASPHARRSGS